MERASCGAAVCSEWASCSLLVLVSQCPLSSQAMPEKKDRRSLTTLHTVTKPAFTRVPVQEVTNRLQDNCGEHML